MKEHTWIKGEDDTRRKKKEKQIPPLLIVAILVVVLILSFLTILSYQALERGIYRERVTYLKEISEQTIKTTDTISNGQWDLATIFSTQLQNMSYASLATVTDFLMQEEKAFNQEKEGLSLMVFDDKGHYYNSSGVQARLSDDLIVTNSGSSERQMLIATLPTTKSTSDEMMFVLRMTKPVSVGDSGILLTHVAVVRDMAVFNKTFQVPVFSGKGENYIISADGTRVYRGQDESEVVSNDHNVFKSLKNYRFLYGGSYETLRKAVLAGESCSLAFLDSSGKGYYVTSSPMSSNGWSLLSIVPSEVVSAEMQLFMNKMLLGMGAIAAVVIASVSFVMYLTVRFRGSQKLMQQQEKANIALEEAARNAQEASQAKTLFLSHISHDIRTPINGILGMADIAGRNMQDSTRVEDCLKKITASSRHLLGLVNDVLDMSRIESGKIQIENDVFNLNDLLEECCSVVTGQCLEKNLRLEKIFTGMNTPYLRGDALHLRQIIINMLSNAIKFTPEGGVITFTARQLSIDGSTAGLYISICDNGIGMSEEFQKKIFEPFAQEDEKARSKYRGTGLGMSIVKQLLDLMGGSIALQSTKGEGSIFTISLNLPIESKPEVMTTEEQKAAEKDLAGARILLAEDNELNMEIALYILEECGASVTPAKNGKIALDIFRREPEGSFDIILMDVMMPVMDGLEATRAIRGCEKGDAGSIPIVAMTANAYAEDRKAALAAGMNHYLSKPIERDALICLLDRLLRKKHSRDK